MTRVLVVDDSGTMRRMIKHGLSMAGVAPDAIAEANDGLEALEQVERLNPPLVVSDVNMPRMTGTAMLAELKDRGYLDNGGNVVMVTSIANSRRLLELIRLGAAKVVRKPFDPTTLPETLGEFLVEPEPEPQVEPEPVDDTADAAEADPVSQALTVALEETLGKMLFMAPKPVAPEVPTSRVLISANVDFEFGQPGTMVLSTTLDTQREIARTMLGEDPNEDDGALIDALQELANILMGEFLHHFKAAVGQDDAEFGFGLPRMAIHMPGGSELSEPFVYEIDEAGHRIYVELCG